MKNNPSKLLSGSDIKVSIDRLTIVADYLTSEYDRNLRFFLSFPFIEEANGGNAIRVLDDETDSDVTPEQVAYISVPPFMQDHIRIDFNPNRGFNSAGGQWLLRFIAGLSKKHFSRCDVAFDVFNLPEVKDYQVWDFGTSKSIFYSRSWEMETTYYGSPSSQKQIRQYNKKLEQEKRHGKILNVDSWWRVELQLRGNKIDSYPSLVKEMLEKFYIPSYKNLENPSQRAIVLSMMVDPTIYASASKATQQRWRKLFKSVPKENEISVAMAQCFVKNFRRLEFELHDVMNKFNIVVEENSFDQNDPESEQKGGSHDE